MILCVTVWIVARRMFGLAVALVSMVILVFEPNTLSQGALVLNNVPLAGLFFSQFSVSIFGADVGQCRCC